MATDIRHIAFIMDGNRRWARENKLIPTLGHKEGRAKAEEVIEWCVEEGIAHITLWALSTENWKKRNAAEKEMFFVLLKEIPKRFAKYKEQGISLDFIGDTSEFPEHVREVLDACVQDFYTPEAKHSIHIAINYGGRAELLRAMKLMIEEGITEPSIEAMASHLWTKGMPDPDMMVRTGGEQRLSGFMPWQLEYAELFFTETYWPAYSKEEFQGMLEGFAHRKRNFGA